MSTLLSVRSPKVESALNRAVAACRDLRCRQISLNRSWWPTSRVPALGNAGENSAGVRAIFGLSADLLSSRLCSQPTTESWLCFSFSSSPATALMQRENATREEEAPALQEYDGPQTLDALKEQVGKVA